MSHFNTIILDQLKQSMVKHNQGKAIEGDEVHASGIYDMCSRRNILALSNKMRISRNKNMTVNLGEALTYEIGRKVQDIVVEHLISIVGKWLCLSCGTLVLGPRPSLCSVCGSKYFKYKETGLKYKIGKFTFEGSVDTLVQNGPENESRINEVKSIEPVGFDALMEPMLQHKYQVMSYLWLIEKLRKKHEILKTFNVSYLTGHVTYVAKLRRNMPIKVFTVQRDRIFEQNMKQIDKDLKAFSKVGTVPDRICSTPLHLMARKCATRELCFLK